MISSSLSLVVVLLYLFKNIAQLGKKIYSWVTSSITSLWTEIYHVTISDPRTEVLTVYDNFSTPNAHTNWSRAHFHLVQLNWKKTLRQTDCIQLRWSRTASSRSCFLILDHLGRNSQLRPSIWLWHFFQHVTLLT